MDRREAVKYISLLLGGTFVGGSAIISGCKSNTGKDMNFTAENIAFLDEVADTILPATSSPGAKAAHTGEFMTVMVNDCYEKGDQDIFHEGMKKLNDSSNKEYDKDFMELSAEQKHNLLVKVDKEAKDYMSSRKSGDPTHYFRMMKELTLLGFFTSEVGCKQALNYVERPGRYEGCVPYVKGEKAYA